MYSVVDKVFYQNGQDQLMQQVMPERCAAIEAVFCDHELGVVCGCCAGVARW